MEPIVSTVREHNAPDIARIGSSSMRSQYQGLVDPVAVNAAILFPCLVRALAPWCGSVVIDRSSG